MKMEKQSAARIDWHLTSGAWFFLDALVGFLVMHLAFLTSASLGRTIEGTSSAHVGMQESAWLFAALLPITAHVFELHNPLLPRNFWGILGRCIGVTLFSTGLLSILVFGVLYRQIGRLILLQLVLYVPLYMFAARFLIWQQSEQRKRRILLLGSSPAVQITRELIERSQLPWGVLTLADCRSASAEGERLRDCCRRMQIDEVVTCDSGGVDPGAMEQLVECLSFGIRASDQSHFVERNFLMVPVENIRQEWFLQADLQWLQSFYQPVKRGTDVVVALIGMVVFAPLVLLAALAIKLESRGPILYSQMRLGWLNRPFRIWKLRTMRVDAEEDGARWAEPGDKRTTRVGRVLRRMRLDEAPQFWNILRGEMSLIGPRPERPEFVEKLTLEIPFYHQRHLIKPGLTGWAQIHYRYGDSVADARRKLCYDLYYVKHVSPVLDAQITLRTIGVVMRGAR